MNRQGSKLDARSLDIHTLDALALGESPIHRLDARAKLITTLVFVLVVASHGKYQLASLTPFFLYPMVLLARSGLPAGYLLHKLMLVSSFAIFLGIANPFLDTAPLIAIGGFTLSGGWVSFLAIMMRFFLAIGGLLLLIAATGMTPLCRAAGQLGVPRPFVVQLLMLYRYLFLLVEEGSRMGRARSLRSFAGRGLGLKIHAQVIGHLLLRSLARGQRIHQAMLLRGFHGEIPLSRRAPTLQSGDWRFMIGWCGFFLVLRFFPVAEGIGYWLTRVGVGG